VKLIFDANLSPSLVGRLRSDYPGSVHVRDVGLKDGSDSAIWEFARLREFAIASKDTDFRERSFVEGSPPKVIWLDVGNAGTREIELLLRAERQRVEQFSQSQEASLLILSAGLNAL
jgi:predicted nuclease of predicted toxin-antitoxin system